MTEGAGSLAVPSAVIPSEVEESALLARSHSSGRLSLRSRENDECLSSPSGVISRYRTSQT